MAAADGLKVRRRLQLLLALVPALMVGGILLPPFLLLLARFLDISAIGSLGGGSTAASLTRTAIWNSFVQGGISALASMAAGLPLGFFLGRYEFRFSRLLRSFAVLPFFLPSIVVVTAFISGFGPASLASSHIAPLRSLATGLTGIVAVNTFFNAPVVAMMTMLAVERGDEQIDEAAKTLGASPWRSFRTIWGRDGLIAGAGGGLLAFLYSFAGFTAPLVIGGPGYFTLEAWIYFLVRTIGNLQLAALLGFIEAAALLLPALTYIIFLGRTRRVQASGMRGGVSAGRGGFFKAGLAYAAAWTAVECYILSSVFAASFQAGPGGRLADYSALFGRISTSALGVATATVLANTLFYGLSCSLLVTAAGLAWIYGRRRISSRIAVAADAVQFLPLVISAVILALSLSAVFGRLSGGSYTWVLIIAAQAVIAVPIVLRVIESGFAAIPGSYAEAALTLGGNAFFEVELPIARSTLASALMFGFAMSLGEFTATNFLATPPFMPLGVQVYALQGARLFGPADAAAAMLLLMSLLSFYLIQKLGDVIVAVR